MRRPVMVLAVTFVGGALVWATGAITEFGSVSGESSDPGQRARIVSELPAGSGVAKPLGLSLMGAALVVAGVLWFRRR